MIRYIMMLMLCIICTQTANARQLTLESAIIAFDQLHSYSTILQSYGNAKHQIHYQYMKPGYVRMNFITPHKGAVLIYRPDTQMVKLQPFGFSKSIILTLHPTATLVRSPSGHRVDKSDIGVLLQNANQLAKTGHTSTRQTDNRSTLITITGKSKTTIQNIHQYKLWINPNTRLPEIVESYDMKNNLIEGLILKDMQINQTAENIFQFK